jgi:uncharacterized membrane protein HdeD (DUF308 family)
MSTTSGVDSVVSEYVPWRKGISWWIVLVQGIVLLAIGVLALWRTDLASQIILIGLGVYLIVAAIWTIVQAMRGRDYGLSVFNLLAAGGGLVAGIGVLIPFILRGRPTINVETLQITSLVTFAIALMAVGVLWLLSSFVERPEGGIVIITLVRGILFLLLGGYILFAVATGTSDVVRWVAIACAVVGGLLIIYSIILNRRQAAPAAP